MRYWQHDETGCITNCGYQPSGRWYEIPVVNEDELPELSTTEYDRWYALSAVVDGVRVGPHPYPKQQVNRKWQIEAWLREFEESVDRDTCGHDEYHIGRKRSLAKFLADRLSAVESGEPPPLLGTIKVETKNGKTSATVNVLSKPPHECTYAEGGDRCTQCGVLKEGLPLTSQLPKLWDERRRRAEMELHDYDRNE